MNCKCTCGRLLKPGYIRCSKCALTAERVAPETDAVWVDKSWRTCCGDVLCNYIVDSIGYRCFMYMKTKLAEANCPIGKW